MRRGRCTRRSRPVRRRPASARRKPAPVNVDLQNAYTRPAEFVTAYETDPRQIDYVNAWRGCFARIAAR
jgi:hypothetical protein